MKKLLLVIVVVFSSALIGSTVLYANSPVKKKTSNREIIIEYLMNGIRSDNFGLRTSSAFLLGEFKSDEAVIELLSMLHNEESDDARIMAALSLLKIEDPRGIYAIKQAIKFDESERVQKMCEKFYYHFLDNQIQ